MPGSNAKSLGIGRTVFVLGIVSLLTDISSEGIYPLIPLFLVETLKTEIVAVGLIEGVANSTASILRIFSGWLSDVLCNRKWLTAAGYGLSAISKPLLATSGSWQTVFSLRFADRMGKGIRTAPRDALIADTVPVERRGVAFGFHRGMDTIGAVTGPLLALWLLRTVVSDYRTLFLLAAIPAVIGVLILVALIREPMRQRPPRAQWPSLALRGFSRQFKLFLFAATVFSIGNSSDAFLILRARDMGLAAGGVLLVYVAFNAVEASLSIWAGALSDRIGRKNVIVAGYLVYAAVYAGFGAARSAPSVWALFGLYGVYNALTQGAQRAFAADLTSTGTRGTGMGAYHALTGLALLPASLIAGYLWQAVSPAAPFYFGAATASLSAILLAVFFRRGSTYTAT